ncbi:hypothetical protein KBD75_00220 [Candidatus Woesebacteria bacterium]|nr:hypothetical protein [Candidatus Woesebacteria bacterium]
MIEVNTESDKKYLHICLLTCQDHFEEEVNISRNKLKIDPLNIDTEKFLHDGDNVIDLNEEIRRIRIIFEAPQTYNRVIRQSILKGIINDEDYSPAILKEEALFVDEITGEADRMVSILISPLTGNSDVVEELNKYKAMRRSSALFEVLDPEQNMPIEDPHKYILEGGQSATRKYIDWYIKRKQGMSLKEIAEAETDKCPKHGESPENNSTSSKCICVEEQDIAKSIHIFTDMSRKFRTF